MDYYQSIDERTLLPQMNVAFSMIVALSILGVFFVGLNPFSNLSDPSIFDASTGREASTYILVFLLAFTSILIVAHRGCLSNLWLGTKPVLILFGWLVVTCVFSNDPATSMRRLTVTMAAYLLAATLPWLMQGMYQFTNVLLSCIAGVLVLSYLGLLLVPDLTIHQSSDLVEPLLAGDWRGIYDHKNSAAIMMAIFLYVGWFAVRVGRRRSGIAIVLASAVFLVFSGGKSSLGLVVIVSGLAYGVARARSLWTKAIIAFGPLALVGFLTVGSVMSPAARSVLDRLPIDATFSGRTDTWKFALDSAAARPWTGAGFEAFWHSAGVQYGADESGQWQREAHTSHNGYLDIALTTGIPGLLLLMFAFLVAPLRDFHSTPQLPLNQELSYLFLKIWLLLLFQNMFEAYFLSRVDAMWFAFALATCGLRYSARNVVRA